MAPPANKRGARAVAALIHAALLLLFLVPLAPWLLAGGKQAVQSRLGKPVGADAKTAPQPRGKVYLRYDVQFGLCNQLNSHVNALMLGHALGVDAVVVPPAWSRNPGDFNHSKFDQQWVKNNPASTLLDLKSMAAAWAKRGIQLVEESAQLPKPEWQDCVRTRALEEQLQESTPDAMKTCQGCSKLYLQAPLVRLLAQARSNIDAVWAGQGPATCVLLDGGSLFWAANLPGSANLGALAAASLRFPPHIEAIADKVAKAVGPVFNGVHLRIEPDMGLDPKAIIPKYLQLMRELGFNSTTPLYVASALLTYDDSAGFDRMATLLQKEGLCSRAVAKEHILPATDLAGLNSEQVAMVDLLVLARTRGFVGHVASTFSFVAHDLRVIRLVTAAVVACVTAKGMQPVSGGREVPAAHRRLVAASHLEGVCRPDRCNLSRFLHHLDRAQAEMLAQMRT